MISLQNEFVKRLERPEAEVKTFINKSRSGTASLAKYGSDAESVETFPYELTEDAVKSLGEYFRMAFYQGILQEIPETEFFPASALSTRFSKNRYRFVW